MAEFLGVEAEIIDHRPGAARGIARAEIAVDIVLAEPGILDRALGDLGVKLGGGFVRRVPGRVFVDPRNVGLALDGQNFRSPLAFLLGSFFLNPGGLIGKRGNIPSGERAAAWRKCLSNPHPKRRRDGPSRKGVLPDGTSGFALSKTVFVENNPMHS